MVIKKQIFIFNIILFIIIIFSGCGNNPNSINSYLSIEKKSLYFYDQGKKNWEKRVNIENAKKSIELLNKAQNLNSNNLEIAILLSKSYHFFAQYIEKKPEKADSLFFLGKEVAWNFISKSDAYINGFNQFNGDINRKKIAGIENISENLTELLFWWSKNYVSYIVSKPISDRLNSREEIETALYKILSIKPDYYYNGPDQIFGIFYARIPGVELAQSISHFQSAINSNPNFFGNYVARAKYLYTKNGDKKNFLKDLNYIIGLDPTILPQIAPENLMEQESAKKLLLKESSLFE